jgi:glucosamine--fructose-6-phosphate aminotransferase (isomerizing)
MCGIFGFVVGREAKLSAQSLKEHVVELFLMSESRGKESSGIHVYLPAVGYAWTLKGDIPASELVTTAEFQEMVADIESRLYKSPAMRPVQPCIILGHSRLVTNGRANQAVNNQPVRAGDVTIVHNGIIVNDSEIWESYPHWQRRAQVDTEIAAVLLNDQIVQGRCSVSATQALFQHIKGSASIAWVHGSEPALTLATNTGDLHYVRDVNRGFAVFASELHILRRVALAANIGGFSCISLKAGNGIAIDATDPEADHFQLAARVISPGLRVREDRPLKHYDLVVKKQSAGSVMINTRKPNFELLRYNETSISNLKRCSRCILPETFPFIRFDHAGVCNYCQNYKPKYKHLNAQAARDALLSKLSAYRNTNGEPDALIPFSGGRDSCYGLHLIKKEFGLSPITFTYDWGMVTDLARRNIARTC